ncbi:MAG: hypothetical protein JWO37_2001 [Acidimicrobiales bacterium]|nr:hypothetical protein [Acidimicrobiales bacterium]
MASFFEGDDEMRLSKAEAFRIVAALLDAVDLIDRTSPAFEVSWERLRWSMELLMNRLWPEE